jgi:hypothetical protein
MSRVEELYTAMPRQVAWLCLKTLFHFFAIVMSGIGREKYIDIQTFDSKPAFLKNKLR